ncbi:hypothetical protein BANRA_05293 [Klebsiella variicola]|nr:hypothetical protein BANRA_03632 [Klebsiella variicola]VCW27640.1 hypothetical protein BANRA_05293 [Klebsiella variicola]
MRLTVRLLMRIYQGASLSWHWSAGVLATVVFGSCCAVKGFMLIISACTGFITSVALGVKRRRRRKGLATERLPLLRPAAPNLTLVDGFRHGRTFHRSQDQVSYLRR